MHSASWGADIHFHFILHCLARLVFQRARASRAPPWRPRRRGELLELQLLLLRVEFAELFDERGAREVRLNNRSSPSPRFLSLTMASSMCSLLVAAFASAKHCDNVASDFALPPCSMPQSNSRPRRLSSVSVIKLSLFSCTSFHAAAQAAHDGVLSQSGEGGG